MTSSLRVVGGLALLVGSCDPFTFDSLKDDAWVQIVDQPTDVDGTFGIDVLALPPPAEGGARFVVASGDAGGLTLVPFDTHGKVGDVNGATVDRQGKGTLEPILSAPTGLAALDETHFLVGASEKAMIVRYQLDFSDGLAVLDDKSAGAATGLSLAAGDLGLGGAAPDVVALGSLSLTVRPDGDTTKGAVTCKSKAPNATQGLTVLRRALATARLGGTHDVIVMSNWELDNSARVRIFDASAIVEGTECPATGFTVPGDPSRGGPTALVVGDLDDNGIPDLVTGTNGMSNERSGHVRVYMNLAATGTPVEQEIALSAKAEDADSLESGSGAHGSRLAIGDIDGDGKNELIVADPAATLNGVGSAGRVLIYRVGGTCDPARTRGPACFLTTLYDPDPDKDDLFGRGLAIGDFKTAAGTKKVLAVTQKGKLWVYFRVLEGAVDPRE